MKKFVTIGILFTAMVFSAGKVSAHCEVPCGIYDDDARIQEIHEHLRTIEKAMTQIKELSDAEEKNHNQIVRWITTKEDHAKKIQDIVCQYFMTQRIKPVQPADDDPAYEKYVRELALLHHMLVNTMKAKQTIDPVHTKAVHDDLEKFSQSYLKKKEESESKK